MLIVFCITGFDCETFWCDNETPLVYEADRLNQEDKEHIAIVDYAEDGGITIKILPKTE